MSYPALVEMTSSSRYGRKSSATYRPKFSSARPYGGPLRLLGPVGAEVLPQPQAQQWQLEPAPPAVAVVVGVVTVPGSLEGHDPILPGGSRVRCRETPRREDQILAGDPATTTERLL